MAANHWSTTALSDKDQSMHRHVERLKWVVFPMLCLSAPALWGTEVETPADGEVKELRARLVQLQAEVEALRGRAQERHGSTCQPGQELTPQDEPRLTPLPTTRLFTPVRADPKEPRTFMSLLQVDSALRDSSIGAVGFGEHFDIVRRESRAGWNWQFGIAGAVFAQFDLETPSSDLINADYVIGLPLTWRRGDWSGRVRLYHQSSHLGDEFLLNTQPQRVNLSFEAIEAIVAHDFGELRVYGGGEYLVDRDPRDLGAGVLHAGLDWRGREVAFRLGEMGGARWVAGLDAKRWEQNGWATQISAKAGLEFAPLGDTGRGGRRWAALLEVYDGPSPYGQFYPLDVRYWGLAIQVGL
jgi:hypothetical protein